MAQKPSILFFGDYLNHDEEPGFLDPGSQILIKFRKGVRRCQRNTAIDVLGDPDQNVDDPRFLDHYHDS